MTVKFDSYEKACLYKAKRPHNVDEIFWNEEAIAWTLVPPFAYMHPDFDLYGNKVHAPVTAEAPVEAKRDNAGKTPYSYLPLDLLDGAARVMAYGAKKYGLNNYMAGYHTQLSPLDSLMRHVTRAQRALLTLEEDPTKLHLLLDVSGQTHVAHIITSAIILIQSLRVKGLDPTHAEEEMVLKGNSK